MTSWEIRVNRTAFATNYRILTQGRNLLAHLLCLLLILSTPVLAQVTPDVTHPQSLHVDGTQAVFDISTPPFCATGDQYGVSFNPNASGGTSVDPFFDHLDPDLQMKLYRQGAGKPSDQRNTYDMGVDPATLNPEALDLNIFPTFEISAQLSLIPSLSYSPNHVLGRMGRLQYGPPKQWHNHYGEIVVLLSPTKSQKIPVGDPLPGANALDDTQRRPATVELQVFFINASGQQVNFYPDPARMGIDNKPLSSPNYQVKYWYSEDGTYKLEDLKADAATDAFDFKLTTSSGLEMTFEPYAYHLDMEKEALTRHFRVDRIKDRYANFVDILYRDEETSPPGPKTLQPWKAKGFANHSDPAQAVMLQEIEYKYDSRNRLEELVLPAVGQEQTQSYKFYYLDSEVAKTLPLGDGTTTNRLKLNNIYAQTLQTGTSGSYGSVRVSPLANVQGVLANIDNSSKGLFLNVSKMGFAPEIGVDFEEVFTSGGFTGEFKSAPHLFHVVDTQSNSQLLKPLGKARQIASNLAVPTDPLRYRYKLDSGHYASAGVDSATYPDYIETGSTTLALGNVDIAVLPRLKHGDLIAWIGSGSTIQSRMLDMQGVSPTHWQGGTYEFPLQSGSATPPSTGLHFIRKDQRDRIAEIEYPGVAGSSKKRLLFKYAENSRNHAEIEEILTFDEDVDSGQAKLMSQTTYTYENVLVQTAAEDLATLSPGAQDEYRWRNCVRVGRELVGPEEHGVKHGVNRLRRHEVIDMLRHKRVRYYQPGQTSNPNNEYRQLETFYGGSWNIALLADSLLNEDNPTAVNDPDLNKTCDVVEWGIAQKPFQFTWQINPDGSAQIFDLSADGVGLDETLAYANSGVRVFKTYQFDTRFKKALEESDYGHFLGSSTQPFTPYYEYFPNYALPAEPECSPCTIPDLEAMVAWPANRVIPDMEDVFALSSTENTTPTIAYGATIDFFEPIPMYGYSLLTDIDPEEPLKKVALGTVHGSFQGDTNNPSRTFFRASALEGIEKILNTQPSQTEAMIDKLLRGQMISRITTVNSIPPAANFLYITYDVPWAYGGSFPSSSCFQYIHQRQKNQRLRPHAQIQLQKLVRNPITHVLEGLKWDGTKNLLDLETNTPGNSPWVMEASRYSNGGYLGKGSATGWTTTGNESTLTGVNAPSEAQAGDFVYHQNKMYQLVENINGTSVKVKPALDGDSQGLSNLQFYRYYSPNAPTTYPYMGYDVFGNNAFKATYKRTELKFTHAQNKATGDDHGLVPNFFDASAIPFTLSLNDSTAPANNDDTTWTYFGRITRQFDTGKLPLDYDNNGTTLANTTDWRMGMVTDWTYPTATDPYKWLPTEKAAYFLPKTLGTVKVEDLNLSLLQGLTVDTDAEDVRTSYRYYAESLSPNTTFASTNPMAHGRLSLEWTGKSDSPGNPDTTHFTVTRYDYDTEGWLAVRDTASFKGNGSSATSDYGIRTTQTHDKATGLVIDEKTSVFHDPTWNDGAGSANLALTFSGTAHQRSHTKNEYDLLGRNTRVESLLPDGETLFGNVTKTMYTSQTQTSVQTLDHGSKVFSTQWTFLNGQGQPVSSLRQRGGESSRIFATYTAYDAFGRPDITGSEREVALTGQQTVLDHAVGSATAGGYSQTRYNLRGEAFGTVVYEAGTGAVQSSWIVKTQDATGNLSTLNVKQVPDTTVAGEVDPAYLNIKALHLNANGLLERVEDHQVLNVEDLWTDVSEVNILSDVGSLGVTTLKAKAVYTFDRMAKVTKAEVGTSATAEERQTRTFTFDQRGRLRKETHPEMPGISVNYSGFDGLDNVGTVKHVNASQTALRTWTSTYDAAGNLLQHQAGAMVTDYVYNYAADFGASNPAAYPEYPRSIRHRDTHATTGSVFLYRNSYEPTNGLLLKRSLFHDRDGFPGESSANLATYNLANAADPALVDEDEHLELEYTYDELGRVQKMTYPTAVQGVQDPTKLDFTYGEESGLLTQVHDLAFSPRLTVLDNLRYGVGDQLTYTDFAKPIASHKNYLSRSYDSLNRLENWKVAWNSGGIPYFQDREYSYDSGGRIHQIQIDPMAGGSFKGFRYAYDALSQLKQARFDKPGTTPAATTWDYVYDELGFGNLTSFKANGTNQIPENGMNLATNRISTDATYSALGEMESYTDNGLSYDLTYTDLGRVKTLTSSDLSSTYHYDHAGMRLFTEVQGSQADEEVQTLYFYDVDGMVLCEWVAEKQPDLTWANHRWDRSYVYLAGKSSMTYEYDEADASQGSGTLPQGPAMLLPTLIHTPDLVWEDVGPGSYDLEIQTDQGKPVAKFIGVNGTQWTYAQLKYGKFQMRARQSEMVWGPWHSVYHMDAASAEKVAQVSLNAESRDQSFYRNHPEFQGDVHFIAGKEVQGLYLGAGETLVLNKPHALLSGTHGSTSFWVKPTLDTASEDTGPNRTFWSLGSVKLTVNNYGEMRVKYPGSPSSQPSILLNGNAWQHVAVVYGSWTIKVYLDNVLVLDLTGAPTSAITTSDMTWGNASTTTGAAVGIDDIRCYNKALTSSDVSDEFNRWN